MASILRNPGAVVGVSEARKLIWGKALPGDELWFFYSKSRRGGNAAYVMAIRDKKFPLWLGEGEGENRISAFVLPLPDDTTTNDVLAFTWHMQILIGFATGFQVEIDETPPALENSRDYCPGQRIAIMRLLDPPKHDE